MKRETIKWLAMALRLAVFLAPTALYLSESVSAQTTSEERYNVNPLLELPAIYTLRAASGALTAGETSTEVWTGPFIDIVVHLAVTTITTVDGDDEVDFWMQTTWNDGSGTPTWCDLENIHYATADNGSPPAEPLIIRLGPWSPISTADNAAQCQDGALADDTKLAYPVGWMIRVKTAVTGAGGTATAYAYSAEVFLR